MINDNDSCISHTYFNSDTTFKKIAIINLNNITIILYVQGKSYFVIEVHNFLKVEFFILKNIDEEGQILKKNFREKEEGKSKN